MKKLQEKNEYQLNNINIRTELFNCFHYFKTNRVAAHLVIYYKSCQTNRWIVTRYHSFIHLKNVIKWVY